MKAIITTLILIGFYSMSFSQEKRLVITERLNVRSGAGVNFDIIDQLENGDTIVSLENDNLWTKIEIRSGVVGYVSSEFLSEPIIKESSSKNKSKSSSWFETIFFLVLLIVIINSARKTLFATSKSSSSRRSSGTKPLTKSQSSRPPISRNSANGVVYRYRIKGNGTAGGFKYVEGMNVEIAVKGLGASGSPFNTITEKLFIQEIARKYNVEPRFQSGIKMLFKHDRVDVEIM